MAEDLSAHLLAFVSYISLL